MTEGFQNGSSIYIMSRHVTHTHTSYTYTLHIHTYHIYTCPTYPLSKRKRRWGSFFGKSFFSRVTHPAVLSAAVLTPGSRQGQGPKRREERKERKQHCKEMNLTSKPGLCFRTFLFFYTLGRIIPTDSYFSEGYVNHQRETMRIYHLPSSI